MVTLHFVEDYSICPRAETISDEIADSKLPLGEAAVGSLRRSAQRRQGAMFFSAYVVLSFFAKTSGFRIPKRAPRRHHWSDVVGGTVWNPELGIGT